MMLITQDAETSWSFFLLYLSISVHRYWIVLEV